MLKYLFTPLPRPQANRSNLIRIFVLGFVASLFVILFKPFDIENNNNIWYFNLLIVSMGLLFSSAIYSMEFVVPRYLKSFFYKWNIWKALLWYTWLIIFVSGVMFLYKSFLSGFSDFTFIEFIFVIGRMTGLGVVILFFTLGLYSYLNIKEIGRLSSNEVYVLNGNNGVVIEVKVNELLFIKSDNNYVDIHLEIEGKKSVMILRSSLKRIEGQLLNPISPILKCHRSYLVNLNKVKIKNKKGRNLSLEVVNTKEEIPVSGSYADQVFKRL